MKTSFLSLTMLVLLLTNGAFMNAQVTIGDLKTPETFSLLELVGNKGLRLPHIDDAQLDVLAAQIKAANLPLNGEGLLIYNPSCGCMEYWNGSMWISLCEASSTPEVEIDAPICNRIRLKGEYYKNAPLGSNHSLTLYLNVIKTGSYNLNASSGNGYYFQKSGVFSETGMIEVTLDGYGIPAEINTDGDILTLTCNGKEFAEVCTIKVKVETLTMGYIADCDNIEVFGEYQTRKYMNSENFVKVPINIFETGSIVNDVINLRTDMVNGIQFSVTKTVNNNGLDTLVLRASGSPVKAGIYRFTFTTEGSRITTCSFAVNFFSTLGMTSADPACRCLDIYNENPITDDGEYWLIDCEDSNTPVKTYCDIKNGGWTLVWSYSEATARNQYRQSNSDGAIASSTGYANMMSVSGYYYNNYADRPINRCTTETMTINYYNFRLNRAEWEHFPNSLVKMQMKVRITENPTDMYDEWALNNYVILSPTGSAQNPIHSKYIAKGRVPAEGKIYGKQFGVKVSGGGTSGGYTEFGNHATILLYSHNGYCTHWDFTNNVSGSSFAVIPNRGGANNTISFSNINNAFGWFSETQPNHHFGKCSNSGNATSSADDFTFQTKTCGAAALYPHASINGGEGRILQWFVK